MTRKIVALAAIAQTKKYDTTCPSSDTVCSFKGDTYAFGIKGSPECWSRGKDSIWSCMFLDTNLECPEGFINIEASCSALEPPNCPSKTDYNLQCKNLATGERSSAGDPGINLCWDKSIDDEDWSCSPIEPNDSCKKGELNISTCPFDKPDYNVPKCPLKDDLDVRCNGAKGEHNSFLRPGNNLCWYKPANSKSWSCKSKKLGICEPNELDISTCPINDPRPICPGEDYYNLNCINKNGLVAKAGKPGKLNCWSKPKGYKNSWSCDTMKGDECLNDELDITKCSFIKPEALCLEKGLKCMNKANQTFEIMDPNAPGCWKLGNNTSISCESRAESELFCPKDNIDIRPCYPKCPKIDASCEIGGENYDPIKSQSSKRADLLCWDPSNGNTDPLSYNCYPKDLKTGLCPQRTLEIEKCLYDGKKQI